MTSASPIDDARPGCSEVNRDAHRLRRVRLACRPRPDGGPDDSSGRSRPRSVIETLHDARGARVSTIRRPDGSSLTVTVPASAMDEDAGASDETDSWIHEEGAGREPPAVALWRLASLVTAGRTHRPIVGGSASVVALRLT